MLAGAGTVKLSGLETLLAGGPIVALLLSLSAPAPASLAAALTRLGIPADAVSAYVSALERGAALLALHCNAPQAVRRAQHLLAHTGGSGLSTEAAREA